MSVYFHEGDKSLEFSVIDYQFALQKNMDIFDANWLTVKIQYSLGNDSVSYTDNCLLADELKEMADEIEDVAVGKETGLIMNFMEPYLKFSLSKAGDIYVVQIRFVYDTTEEWKEIYVVQSMTKQELCEMKDTFRALSNRFPVRKIDG